MLRSVKKLAFFGLLVFAFISSARAAYLWVEPAGPKEAKVYFGGFQENEKQKSGGGLDDFTKIEAWSASGPNPIPLTSEKLDDHFLLSGLRAYSSLLVQDLSVPVIDGQKFGQGMAKPMYYARFQNLKNAKSAEPFFAFDIFMNDDQTAYVFFKKKPAPNAKIMVYAPNGWKQELKTDESGRAKISMPWPGQYVLETNYKEDSKTKTWDSIRHRATCTFIKN